MNRKNPFIQNAIAGKDSKNLQRLNVVMGDLLLDGSGYEKIHVQTFKKYSEAQSALIITSPL